MRKSDELVSPSLLTSSFHCLILSSTSSSEQEKRKFAPAVHHPLFDERFDRNICKLILCLSLLMKTNTLPTCSTVDLL